MASLPPKQFPVDALHAGIRVAVTVAFFGTAAVAIFVVPAIAIALKLTGILSVLFFVGGVSAISIGGALLVDRTLRKIWPSGRWLKVEQGALVYHDKDGAETVVALNPKARMIVWHFVIQQNRTWVPRGWYCVACQLAQGETQLTPYAFLKPEQAAMLPRWRAFQEVIPRKDLVRRDAELPDDQIRLRLAERTRWESGIELFADDFHELVVALDQSLDVWSSSGRSD